MTSLMPSIPCPFRVGQVWETESGEQARVIAVTEPDPEYHQMIEVDVEFDRPELIAHLVRRVHEAP